MLVDIGGIGFFFKTDTPTDTLKKKKNIGYQ